MSALFTDLLDAKAQAERFEALHTQYKQRIQERMGLASVADFETGSVSWKRSKDTQYLDTAKLLADYPDLRESYTTSRKGSRRFVITASP